MAIFHAMKALPHRVAVASFAVSRRALLALTIFVVACLSTAVAHAATKAPKYALSVAAERAGAVYERGETVTFVITLTQDGEPVRDAQVSWTTSRDGLDVSTPVMAKVVGGRATVTGTLDEPGFLQCRVTYEPAGKGRVTAVAGAAIDPLQIKPSMEPPDDFDAYWAAQKQQLAAVPVNARLTTVKSPTPGIETFDLQADSIGEPVSGYFARPENAKPASLPIILTVHGAGVRSSSLAGAASWASQGFLALDINAHGLPNGKPSAFYSKLANGELKDYRVRGRESRDTVYFRGMFLRLVRALDFLTAQPQWDGRTVVVYGSSQGGAQAIVAAGLDPRVTFFAAGVPAMCDHTGFAANRINGWPKFIATGETPDPQVVAAVRYYDAMNFATRTEAAGIMTVGFIDTTCPPSSVYAAFNAATDSGPAWKIFNDVPTAHANSPQAIAAMKQAVMEHVARSRSGR